MNGIALFWIILFGCAALMFFGIAGVISVFGFRDLRALLSKSSGIDSATDPGHSSDKKKRETEVETTKGGL
jgi:hypothetical protein